MKLKYKKIIQKKNVIGCFTVCFPLLITKCLRLSIYKENTSSSQCQRLKVQTVPLHELGQGPSHYITSWWMATQ
jgi:hypothetical protein